MWSQMQLYITKNVYMERLKYLENNLGNEINHIFFLKVFLLQYKAYFFTLDWVLQVLPNHTEQEKTNKTCRGGGITELKK